MNSVADFDFDRQDTWRRRRKLILRILIWIFSVAAVIAAAYFVVKYSVERTNMVGDSMSPTLENNDTIIVNKLSYLKSDPERFDVIVYKAGGNEHNYYCIKRVYGLPGETVQVLGGSVYINGEKIEETINVEPMIISGLAADKIVLDEDEYFVLGDNRNASEDSRFANVGNIPRSSIIGKAWIRTNNFGFISKFNAIEDESDDEDKDR